MRVYAAKELPTINDTNLVRCCVYAQEMRRTVSAFVQHIISQFSLHPVTTPIRVALAITLRMGEGSLSVELLCIKNRVRDAAILLLSLYELQLDVQYIALDLSRAGTWIDHTQENKKPWQVASQMREICTTQNELDAEQWLYRTYSMVKHCNPAGANFAFPIAASRDMLQLDLDDGNNPMVRAHMFVLGDFIHRTGAAASRIWTREGLAVGDFADRLNEQFKTLSKYNEQHVLSVLQQFATSEPPHEGQASNGT